MDVFIRKLVLLHTACTKRLNKVLGNDSALINAFNSAFRSLKVVSDSSRNAEKQLYMVSLSMHGSLFTKLIKNMDV